MIGCWSVWRIAIFSAMRADATAAMPARCGLPATAATYTNTVAAGALQTSNGSNAVSAVATLVISASITPVPTLPEWALITLAACLLLSGFLAIRRKRLTD